MPCYTMQLITVVFKAENRELLFKALNELKWQYTASEQTVRVDGKFVIDLANKRVEVPDYLMTQVNELKRQYSIETIKKSAQLNKWTLRQQKGAAKFQAVRY